MTSCSSSTKIRSSSSRSSTSTMSPLTISPTFRAKTSGAWVRFQLVAAELVHFLTRLLQVSMPCLRSMLNSSRAVSSLIHLIRWFRRRLVRFGHPRIRNTANFATRSWVCWRGNITVGCVRGPSVVIAVLRMKRQERAATALLKWKILKLTSFTS